MNRRAGGARRSAGIVLATAVAAAAGVARATEMVVYDWNGPVTKAERGFPRDIPPKQNGDWTKPINYAEGTYFLRVEIRRQPVPQQMRLQFCVWQAGTTPMREMCSPLADLIGRPGTVVTWSVPVPLTQLRRKLPIIWTQPRKSNGVAIKDERGFPISDYGNPSWNWFGENPDAWYPLDMRFTVVVVAKGDTFSGWDNYIPPSDPPQQLQAENATLSQATVATDHAGYTGAGFVDYVNVAGSYVEWTATAAAGAHSLTFRYANGSTASRAVEISVNGSSVGSLDFAPTGDWTSWSTRTLSATLPAGSVRIRATATGAAGGPNLDRLDLAGP